MAKWLRKLEQSAGLVGKVFNNLTTNSDIDAPSINAVRGALYRPNLLINGDFQCWQRGDTLGINDNTQNTNGFKYFADMWNVYFERGAGNSYTFEKVSNGVKCSVSKEIAINQFITQALDENKYYILVVSINDIIHTLTFKGQETKESSDFTIKHMSVNSTGTYNRIIIKVKNNDIINYADLFEGDIAYPHVKEDSANALMRCQNKLLYYTNIFVGGELIYMKKANDTLSVNIFLPYIMKNTTIKADEVRVTFGNNATSYSTNIYNYYIYGNCLRVYIRKQDETAFETNFGDVMAQFINLEITNEPV